METVAAFFYSDWGISLAWVCSGAGVIYGILLAHTNRQLNREINRMRQTLFQNLELVADDYLRTKAVTPPSGDDKTVRVTNRLSFE